jgi:hypothetical protein
MLRLSPLLAATGLLAAAVPAAAQDPYPTDTCVSTKLESAAVACQWVVGLTGLHAHLTSSGNPPASSQAAAHWDALLALRLSQVREGLAAHWSDAEANALANGVECSDTTVSSDAMATLLEDGASSIVEATTAAAGPGRSGGTCSMPLARKAATACRGFLEAYGEHLAQRSQDRGQTRLAGQLEAAAQRLARGLQGTAEHCGGDATAAEIEARVGALVDDALLAATVSPSVPTGFSEVVPGAQVDYAGRTLEPTCSAGTPWSFWVRRGTVNKLLVYYQGGGACWSGLTCGGIPGLVNPPSNRARAPSTIPRTSATASPTSPIPTTRSATGTSSSSRTAPATCTGATPSSTTRTRSPGPSPRSATRAT